MSEMEEYIYAFTADDIKTMVAAAIDGKADIWEQEAALEGLKGAANLSMIGTLTWGVRQLRQFSTVVRSLPSGEVRLREVETVVPVNGDGESDESDLTSTVEPIINQTFGVDSVSGWPDSEMTVISDSYGYDEIDDEPVLPPEVPLTIAVDSATGAVTEIKRVPVPQDTTRHRGRPKKATE